MARVKRWKIDRIHDDTGCIMAVGSTTITDLIAAELNENAVSYPFMGWSDTQDLLLSYPGERRPYNDVDTIRSNIHVGSVGKPGQQTRSISPHKVRQSYSGCTP